MPFNTMKTRLFLIYLASAVAAFGTAGDIEMEERNSNNQRVLNKIADPADDRLLIIDDSNAQGAKSEGAVIGAGLAFDGK